MEHCAMLISYCDAKTITLVEILQYVLFDRKKKNWKLFSFKVNKKFCHECTNGLVGILMVLVLLDAVFQHAMCTHTRVHKQIELTDNSKDA